MRHDPIRRGAWAGLVCVCIVAAACTSANDPCTEPADVTGAWSYSGAQESPVRAGLSRTLSVSRQSCGNFDATFDVVETDQRGQSRRLAGVSQGRVVNATGLRFDAFVGVGARQHIGVITPDSVYGSCVETSGSAASAPTASGTFRLRRGQNQ